MFQLRPAGGELHYDGRRGDGYGPRAGPEELGRHHPRGAASASGRGGAREGAAGDLLAATHAQLCQAGEPSASNSIHTKRNVLEEHAQNVLELIQNVRMTDACWGLIRLIDCVIWLSVCGCIIRCVELSCIPYSIAFMRC